MGLIPEKVESHFLGKTMNLSTATDALIKAGEIKPLRIVCPNMDNSRGINPSETYQEFSGKCGVVHKGRYKDYLVEEIIPYVDHTFPAINDRSARYIGGIPSGGYTALSIGLRHPELFAKIGGHMTAVDLSYAEEDERYFSVCLSKLSYKHSAGLHRFYVCCESRSARIGGSRR